MAYPTSQTIKDLFASETPQVFRGTFTFADSTTLVVDQSKVIMGSMVLDRSCVSGSSLELGSCIASEFSMTLLNDDNSLDGKNFEGAEIYAEIGVSDGTNTYYIPLGRFIVDGVPKVRDTVSINALDRMCKFDVEATGLATWWGSGEKTIQDIITKCRTTCGVTLATNISSFPNISYGAKIPEEWIGGTAITYRQLLSYAVGCMGKIAWMNAEGNLEIGFAEKLDLDTSAIAGIAVVGVAIVGDSSGYGVLQSYLDESNRYSSEYEDYTVTITGAYCNITNGDDETQYIIGTDNYAFDLSDNPLVAYNPSVAISHLGGLVGIAYTPISAVTVPYPWLFPMDWVSYKKGETNLYSIVTNFTFTMNGNNGIKSAGENPTEKSRASVGSVSKAVKKMVEYTNEVAVNTLTQAQTDATILITSATGGQMYFRKENGKIVEATMMDDTCYADFISSNPQYNVGKCWRWNKNGFGFSSTGYNGTYGLALTANGEIVADYITTGTMTADRINGGILKLGGSSNGDGQLQVYNSSNSLVMSANNSGLYAIAGTIGGWDISSATLKATSGGLTTGLQVPSSGIYAIAVGSTSASSWSSAPFRVTHAGALTATNATITGNITASSGAIAGWTITSDQIQFDSKGYANQLVSGNIQGCLRSPTANFSGSQGCLVVQSCNGGNSWTQLACVYYNGTINGSAFNTISDRNLKSDINDLDAEQSAEFIYSLKPVNYRLTISPEQVRHGFIAQDVEEIVYDSEWGIVSEDENGTKNLGYTELIADLVATVQTQNERIKALEARIQALEER